MQITIYSKSSTVTDAMSEYAQKKFSKLEKFLNTDEPVKVTLENVKKNLTLKCQAVLFSNKRIRCEISGKDYYRIIDKCVSNLVEQAKAAKEKISYKGRLEKVETKEEVVEMPTIKKVKHFILDETTEYMAMTEMEKLGHESYIFKNQNLDGKICLLYRRLDGDFSMIVVDD